MKISMITIAMSASRHPKLALMSEVIILGSIFFAGFLFGLELIHKIIF